MDLSKLSDSDLEALQSGDLTKLSDAALAQLQAEAPAAQGPVAAEGGQGGPVSPEAPLTPMGALVGGAKTAVDVAQEHPWLTGGAALAGGKLLSNVPGVAPTLNAVGSKLIPGYGLAKNVATGIGQAAEKFAGASQHNALLDTYKSLQHTASQYVKGGQQVPQGLIDSLKEIEGRIIQQGTGAAGQTAKAAGAVAPQAGQAATTAAAESPSMLSRASNLVKAYGPALAKLGTGLQLALHSGELNAGEDEELRKMREREKQMNGGQAQNAINSGYAQQLRLMGRR